MFVFVNPYSLKEHSGLITFELLALILERDLVFVSEKDV